MVVVIAILAAITVVAYRGVTTQAQDSSTSATYNQIKTKAQANQVTNGSGAIINLNSSGTTPLSAATFGSANSLSGIESKICYAADNYILNEHYEDSCYVAHAVGVTPNYDKKLVFVHAGWYSNGTTLEVAHWSNKEGGWEASQLFTDNNGTFKEEKRDVADYKCAPFTTMQYFEAGCKYVQNDL